MDFQDTFQAPYRDAPDTLQALCMKIIIKKPDILSRYISYLTDRCPNSIIPTEISELLARSFREYALTDRFARDNLEEFFKHFKHRCVPLTRVDFSGLPVSEQFFESFFNEYKDQLDEINISNCPNLAEWDLRKLNGLKTQENKRHNSEKTLIIGETCVSETADLTSSSARTRGLSDERIFDDDLRIKKLVLHNGRPPLEYSEFTINRNLSKVLTPTMSNTLKYLDLSTCIIGKGSALMQLESLEILILYNCDMTYPDVVTSICQLSKLHTLDLSREVIESEDFRPTCHEPQLLDMIVSRLTYLTRLDISGTDFTGGKDRNITAFERRINQPFSFLGLFHTVNDAAFSSYIPAITVAGEANETQILNACEAYIDRRMQLERALNDLYNLYKTISPSDCNDSKTRALNVILNILTKHIRDEQVITYTTVALWCIVKINVQSRKLFNDTGVRRIITSKLLDVMHFHNKHTTILINGGLTLLLLGDITCEHYRMASISLQMCLDRDPRAQSFGVTLLNALAMQVGGDQKIYIGKLKAIEILIDIIRAKIEFDNCDEILEIAWSTLWNITDETPVNCERFLDCKGLTMFESCMDKFNSNKEVLKNIMGLLGNVAECKALRTRFMDERYIVRFESLLSSSIDGIECSYNACGILAHIISDGQEFWDQNIIKKPDSVLSREAIMAKMRWAISEWPINSTRNINYRSFEPITRLLDEHIDPAAQFWAAFALANLTRINPAKYCPMLLPFNGLEKLRKLANSSKIATYVSNLAAITIYQYELFGSERTLAGLEQCESTDMEVIKSFRAESNNSDSEMSEIML